MGYSVKPYGMQTIGNTYWPDGLPTGSSKPAWKDRHVDSMGMEFFICYTQEQIDAQVARQVVFAPFFPLMVSGDICGGK